MKKKYIYLLAIILMTFSALIIGINNNVIAANLECNRTNINNYISNFSSKFAGREDYTFRGVVDVLLALTQNYKICGETGNWRSALTDYKSDEKNNPAVPFSMGLNNTFFANYLGTNDTTDYEVFKALYYGNGKNELNGSVTFRGNPKIGINSESFLSGDSGSDSGQIKSAFLSAKDSIKVFMTVNYSTYMKEYLGEETASLYNEIVESDAGNEFKNELIDYLSWRLIKEIMQDVREFSLNSNGFACTASNDQCNRTWWK